MAHVAQLTLTEAQDGTRVQVHVGDAIEIRLPEIAAAGFRWTVTSLDRARVTVVNQHYEPGRPGVGSAVTAVTTLAAKASGKARVELAKLRPWEPGSASGRFAVDLEILE